jgi:acylphosphatase
LISAHVTISGHVQGVGYRANAKRVADRLGLVGWVMNLPDGSVELVAEGTPWHVEEFIEWCRVGPYGAIVEDVAIEKAPAKGELVGFQRR